MQQILTYDVTKLHSLAMRYEFNMSWDEHNITLLSANYIIVLTEYGAVEHHTINTNPSPKVHQLDRGRWKDDFNIPKDLDEACTAVAQGINMKRAKIAAKRHDKLGSLYLLKPVYTDTQSPVDTRKAKLEKQVRDAKRALNDYNHKTAPNIGTMANPYRPPKYAAIIGATQMGTDNSPIMVWEAVHDPKGLSYFKMGKVDTVQDIVKVPQAQLSSLQITNLLSLLQQQYPLNNHNFHRVPMKVIASGELDDEIKHANSRGLHRKPVRSVGKFHPHFNNGYQFHRSHRKFSQHNYRNFGNDNHNLY